MNPATHFLAGWTAATVSAVERRDRLLISAAGVVSDADGPRIIAELGYSPGLVE